MDDSQLKYAGFWVRTLAALIDTVFFMIILAPLLTLIYGTQYWANAMDPNGQLSMGTADLILNYVFPALAVILFWIYRSATPGKIITKVKIVDAKTGGKPSVGQLIGRYLGYYVSLFSLGFGILWVAFDKRKQGWHDKLAGTLVIVSEPKTEASTQAHIEPSHGQ
jgi:uncharacterized RDD family membrane protein YckC